MNRAANIPPTSQHAILDYCSVDPVSEQSSIFDGDGDVSTEVATAQAQLEALRKRQEEIEQEKDALEKLREKQSRFRLDRDAITSDLKRSLALIERDRSDAEQLIAHFKRSEEHFMQHLGMLSGIQDHDWQREQLDEELDSAGEQIAESRKNYTDSLKELEQLILGFKGISTTSLHPDANFSTLGIHSQVVSRNFLYWFRSGLAFSLPIITFALAAMAYFFLTD